MNKKELKAILTKDKEATLSHTCPDGTEYTWIPRKENPKLCPRCATRLSLSATKEPKKGVD